MNQHEFDSLFQGILHKVFVDAERYPKILDLDGCHKLKQVSAGLSELLGDKVTIQCQLFAFNHSGGISADGRNISLDHDALIRLRDILSLCDTFCVTPMINGQTSLGFTVPKCLVNTRTDD